MQLLIWFNPEGYRNFHFQFSVMNILDHFISFCFKNYCRQRHKVFITTWYIKKFTYLFNAMRQFSTKPNSIKHFKTEEKIPMKPSD